MRPIYSPILRSSVWSRRFLSNVKKSELGVATMGLGLLAVPGMLEMPSFVTKTTSLEGCSALPLDDHSVMAEEVFLEYLTRPLGVVAYVQKNLWGKEQLEESTTNSEKEERDPKASTAKFPSLQAQILSTSQDDGDNVQRQNFSISANDPIEIDNEIFQGQVMLVLRPLSPEDDPKFEQRMFSKHTSFQIQIQGRFKKPISKDKLYVGGELAGEMKLGPWTKKVSNLLLMLLSKNVGNNMSYSFGTDTELPYISFPLHTGMADVVMSKPENGTAVVPPKIGTPFVESEESKKLRQHGNFPDWDTDAIYSMSYTSGSVDLSTWKVVVPFEMDLSRFWGDSPMRLVIYENDSEKSKGKRYLFNLQIQHLPTAQFQSKN